MRSRGELAGSWPVRTLCVSVLVLKHQCENAMSRLTITLSESRYRALKEASVQRDKTIGQLIDESLDHYGQRTAAPQIQLGRSF
jgi:hypothetical protein